MKRAKAKGNKYAWTVKVGEKGQIVIPKEAREVFGIKPGDTLIMLADEHQGIATVSYTHLDVYKRQTLACAEIRVIHRRRKSLFLSLRPVNA